MASSSAGTPLFRHIRYLMITTIPSFLITVLLYLIYGFIGHHNTNLETQDISDALLEVYHITPFLFIVPAITGILIYKRMPAILVVFVSAIMGGVTAYFFQPSLCDQLAFEAQRGFWGKISGIVRAMYGASSIETGNDVLNALVSTKGMSGMLNTIWLVICAMTFGGVMEASGMLQTITEKMINLMRTTFSTVAATSASCLFLNAAAADQYIAILLPGKMFTSIYKQKGYKPELLSRTLEDSATVTSVLIPWNTCGMAQSSVLGVATLTYLPYSFFNLISPIMTLLVAGIGYKISQSENEYDEEIEDIIKMEEDMAS